MLNGEVVTVSLSMTESNQTEGAEQPPVVAQSLGGKARADKLSPEKRKAIARIAAEARWGKAAEESGEIRLPKATHSGELKIGGMIIPCAVLDGGIRVITQRGMFVALGMNKNPSKGQSAIDDSPGFLSANNLKPFISEDLKRSWKPIPFRLPKGSGGYKGNIAFGYDAKILPLVCHVYLDAKEALKTTMHQAHIVKNAKILDRGFSIVGIVALVDEATGYQDVRDRLALHAILEQYLSGVLLEYASMFPIIFYKEMFRLKNWAWNNGKMPGVVGKYTNDLVYQRITPGLLGELQERNPVTETGHLKHKHFQWMNKEIGHPALTQHLGRLIGMMEFCESWDEFKLKVDKKLPKYGTTLMLDI